MNKRARSIRPFELPLCDTSVSCPQWSDMISCIHRRQQLFGNFPRAWTIRGEWLGTKLFTPEPNGESYTGLYRVSDRYTKINTGFSGSNTPDDKPMPKIDQTRTRDGSERVSKESRVDLWTIQGCNSTKSLRVFLLDVEGWKVLWGRRCTIKKVRKQLQMTKKCLKVKQRIYDPAIMIRILAVASSRAR
jgi:hypothetical protein